MLLSLALVFTAKFRSTSEKEQLTSFTRLDKTILLILMLVAPVVTYVAHRPIIDDAIYVGTAADAVAHPDLPVLSHDVAYGDQKLPLMLPSYAVESYELLIGAMAWWLGVEPILLAHAFFPTFIAMLVPIAWAGLMRILAPRYWAAGTVLALFALNAPADPRGFGFFALVGLFVGKSILASVGIPLLYTYAWRFEESGNVWDWLILAAITIGCVGLSASAIFVASIALTLAAIAGWRNELTLRPVLVVLPCLYLLVCGICISRNFGALEHLFAYLPASAALAVTMAFGTRTENLIFFALIAAPFLVRSNALRRVLLLLILCYFLVSLNPFTFDFLSRFTTRDASWRLLWCAPIAGVIAVALVGAIQSVADKWGKRGAIAAVLLLSVGTAALMRHSPLARVRYSLTPLKVAMPDYAIAREASAETPPNSTLLAPDTVAVWVPTFVNRAPLVSVRQVYDDEMGTHMAYEDAHTRRALRELISGVEFSPERREELLNALPTYRVGLMVVTEAVAGTLGNELSAHGYSPAGGTGNYVFFLSSSGATFPHPSGQTGGVRIRSAWR
ncbi:MAG: DUF6077 domain-containing protein [Terriglobales bacterium]